MLRGKFIALNTSVKKKMRKDLNKYLKLPPRETWKKKSKLMQKLAEGKR